MAPFHSTSNIDRSDIDEKREGVRRSGSPMTTREGTQGPLRQLVIPALCRFPTQSPGPPWYSEVPWGHRVPESRDAPGPRLRECSLGERTRSHSGPTGSPCPGLLLPRHPLTGACFLMPENRGNRPRTLPPTAPQGHHSAQSLPELATRVPAAPLRAAARLCHKACGNATVSSHTSGVTTPPAPRSPCPPS